jgi:hypothetical protein
MADWTLPTSLIAGDVFTAARWNTDVVGNIPFFDWKVSSATVAGTVTETDLFNGEIIIPASQMGSNERLLGWASGDNKNNSGGNIAAPRFKLKLDSTVLIDTGAATGTPIAFSATRGAWQIWFSIQEMGTTSSQEVAIWGWVVDGAKVNFTAGTGLYALESGASSPLVIFGRNTTSVSMASSRTLALTVINGSANANVETKLFAGKIAIGT